MCGIVGMSFRRDRRRNIVEIQKLFTAALVEAQVRGSAATSVTLMSRSDENDTRPRALTLRSPLPAREFVKSEKYKKVLSRLNSSSLSIIGHTRAVSCNATAKNNYNNHPHIAGPIVGVHNGGVVNDAELWKKYEAFTYMQPRGKCDSEIIFALINHHLGIYLTNTEEAICKAMEEINGWFALALVNLKEPEKIFLLRDNTTDLDIAWWTEGEIAMFSSEFRFLEKPFKKAGLAGKLRKHHLEPMTIFTLDSGTTTCERQELYVHTKTMKKVSSVEQAKIIEEHKEEYEISQGRGKTKQA